MPIIIIFFPSLLLCYPTQIFGLLNLGYFKCEQRVLSNVELAADVCGASGETFGSVRLRPPTVLNRDSPSLLCLSLKTDKKSPYGAARINNSNVLVKMDHFGRHLGFGAFFWVGGVFKCDVRISPVILRI